MTEINLTIKELCNVVEGESSLNPSFLVCNISSLESATEKDLAIVFDPEDNSVFDNLSSEKIKQSHAGVFLASKPVVSEKQYIFVKDPLQAVQKLANFLATYKQGEMQNIHQSSVVSEWAIVEDNVIIGANAVIDDDVKIGCGASVGANVFIGRGAQIGCNVILHPGVNILDRCIVGDHTIIHSGAVVGSDGFGYRVMKTGLRKIPHLGIVRIGENVEIGANTTIDRAVLEETVIGDGVKLDNHVHIAHNVKIGPCTAILAHTGIAGSTTIGAGCQIGGLVAIRDHLTIGNGVKIVSKTGVLKDLKDGEVVCGVPSMPFMQWKRLMVAMTRLPDAIRQVKMIHKYIEVARQKKGFWRKVFRRG